tara:strand:+ start:2727 stop:3410 length:684 start_codon:yes stop_codon:yes gene_type:complete
MENKDILTGLLLIVVIWTMITFIAFVIFDRDTHVLVIIPTWIIAISLLLYLLREKITTTTSVTMGVVVLILVVLYFIPVSSSLPEEALTFNSDLSNKYGNRTIYSQKLFFELEKKWESPTRQYLLEPHKVFFIKSAKYFWNVEGYVDSNIQAQMYRNLLLASPIRFNKFDVKVEWWHWCTNSPHSVVAIKNPDRIFYADLWAVDHFDEYEFGQFTPAPCNKLKGVPI